MVNPYRFYTYAYLRKDGTPYYVGKGEGNRVYYKRSGEVKPPKDRLRIIFLKQNLLEEEAFNHEIYMISVFGRKDLGTGILHNRTNGGEGCSGIIRSEEYKRKSSESRKGKYKGEKNPHYGKPHTEESKRKMREKRIGKLQSKETKMKIKKSQTGKFHSEETKNKMSEMRQGKNNPNYGNSHSEETKRKMSEKKKGKNNPSYGKKCWNDGNGNVKRSIECPGDGWVLGMGKKRLT